METAADERLAWVDRAQNLINQQIWCWGQDILRPKGNWLLQMGFDQTQRPEDRKDCSSVYTLELPGGRCVVLRGFGVFYGDPARGGVYLPRFNFQPQYTVQSRLVRPPWTDADLPVFVTPTADQRRVCTTLTLDLMQWIGGYEEGVLQRLGIAYRNGTLKKWDNGKRSVIPADQVPAAWRELSQCYQQPSVSLSS